MAVSDAQAFVNKFFSDESLREKVMAAGSPDDKYAVIQEAGFSFSKEDAMELLPEGVSLEDLQGLDENSEELPDEILEAVAGGKGESWTDQEIVNTSIAGVGAAAAVVGAAAGAAAA